MKKAAAYARVSGQKQSVNGNSIPVLLARTHISQNIKKKAK